MKRSFIFSVLLMFSAVFSIQATNYKNIWLAVAVVLALVAVLAYTFWRSEQGNRN